MWHDEYKILFKVDEAQHRGLDMRGKPYPWLSESTQICLTPILEGYRRGSLVRWGSMGGIGLISFRLQREPCVLCQALLLSIHRVGRLQSTL